MSDYRIGLAAFFGKPGMIPRRREAETRKFENRGP